MNAKQFQDLLKESKDILQEGLSMTDRLSKYRDKEDLGPKYSKDFYTRYDKKSLMEIIRNKLEEVGEIVDNPSIILDKLASFIDDIKNPKSEYHQNRDNRPYEE